MPPRAIELAADPASLADFIDLDGGFPNDVTDQGQTGECTAHGSLNDIEFVLAALGFIKQKYSHKAQYYLSRVEGGFPAALDSGAYVRDTVKVLSKIGAILESLHTDATPYPTPPSSVAIADAAKRRVLKYVSIPVSVPEIKASLAVNRPVIIGFRVPQDFMSVGRDGLVSNEVTLIPNAGHCVIVVGYDDRPGSVTFGRFKIRNSWGKGWGAEGRAWVTYQWLMALGADFWAITDAVGEGKVEPAPVPVPPVPVPTKINIIYPPVSGPVGKQISMTFSVADQDGAVFDGGRAVVTPLGNVVYAATQVDPGALKLYTYSNTPQKEHPASEQFRFRIEVAGLRLETPPIVIGPVVPVPVPPVPAKRKAVKILYDDGSIQDIS